VSARFASYVSSSLFP